MYVKETITSSEKILLVDFKIRAKSDVVLPLYYHSSYLLPL